MKQWYFDAWDVLDGLAFVSKRSAESIDADHTVFFSVPDLEAVPVGRISTGLLATRFNFQQGFRNFEGEEIGFESLDQVREAIRRGYLAGGIGPGPIGAPEGPVTPGGDAPSPERSSLALDGGQYYELCLAKEVNDAIASKDYSQLADERKRPTLMTDLLQPSSIEPLWRRLRAFAEATIFEWVRRFPQNYEAGSMWNAFCHWHLALVWMRLWEHPLELVDNLLKSSALSPHEKEMITEMPNALSYARLPYVMPPPKIESSILFAVPCPLRLDWDKSIRTLSDKLFLGLSTRYYFVTNNNLPEFVPALLASMVMAASNSRAPLITFFPNPNPSYSPHFQERSILLGSALRWLENELPQLALPEEAENAIEAFAWSRLTQRSH